MPPQAWGCAPLAPRGEAHGPVRDFPVMFEARVYQPALAYYLSKLPSLRITDNDGTKTRRGWAMSLIECSECKKEMSDKAASCPNCGAPNTMANKQSSESKSGAGRLIAIVIGAFVLLLAIAMCGRGASNHSSSSPSSENLSKKVDPESNQAMAALINMNGCLCAKVTSVRHVSGDTYFVDCVEMRDGSGTTHYSVDLGTGKIKRRF